jgi:hypothetical protein
MILRVHKKEYKFYILKDKVVEKNLTTNYYFSWKYSTANTLSKVIEVLAENSTKLYLVEG